MEALKEELVVGTRGPQQDTGFILGKTSQRPVAHWHELIADPTFVDRVGFAVAAGVRRFFAGRSDTP